MSRSMAQQIDHWARVGSAVEEQGLAGAPLRVLLAPRLPLKEVPTSKQNKEEDS